MMMFFILVFCLVLGIFVGLQLPVAIPIIYVQYMSIGILAALDSVFGGFRAHLEGHYDNVVFLTGFVTNALLAAGLAYLGDRLGVELYLAAIVAFGVRVFNNIAIIRRDLLKK